MDSDKQDSVERAFVFTAAESKANSAQAVAQQQLHTAVDAAPVPLQSARAPVPLVAPTPPAESPPAETLPASWNRCEFLRDFR